MLKVFTDRIDRDNRTLKEIKYHYEIEVELADKLRNANTEERRYLYTNVYNELFNRVPSHPQLVNKTSQDVRLRRVASEMVLVKRFISRDTIFLEVGAGDCWFSKEVAKVVHHVIAIDVSHRIIQGVNVPSNVTIMLSDGTNIPVKYNSIDVVYSNQLMEHLHPDDAKEQLRSILVSLRPSGFYICVTPNKLNGPHDISRGFDDIASGFHLKEYLNSELHDIFVDVGFRNICFIAYFRHKVFIIPKSIVLSLEKFLLLLPSEYRKVISSMTISRELLGVRIVGRK
jgi:SAM-dependent methyltransferase